MTTQKTIDWLKVSDVLKAFKIAQPQIYYLETMGKLRKRPFRKVTWEWIQDLITWHRKVRGELPDTAKTLLRLIKTNEQR